jgi:Methyltransferase domain/Glycosyl transferase family 2
MQSSLAEEYRRKPDVSVVVVIYNIPREAPRTLLSLSAAYQRHIHPDDYEVIVVDNGSTPPLDPKMLEALPGNFRLIRIDPAPPSPAHAVNRGIAEAKGEIIGIMIDGARIVTPGLVHFARDGARLYSQPVVATLGWYLGYDFQNWAMQAGYDKTREDALLAKIGWPQDGYRLFEIATLDESSIDGWLLPISESNALFLTRAMWTALDGVDERFDAPGGGLLNLDTFRRAVELPGAELVTLLGEATFHQLHGGIATNSPVERYGEKAVPWHLQYQAIRGQPWNWPRRRNPPTFLGTLPRPALTRFVRAAIDPVWRMPRSPEPPLGHDFDRALWSLGPTKRPIDPAVAALVDLAQSEFRAGRHETAAGVARLARERAPDEPEPQRILALVGAWLPIEGPPAERRAAYHFILGKAFHLLGEKHRAAEEYRTALTFDHNFAQAHAALAKLERQRTVTRNSWAGITVGSETASAIFRPIVFENPDRLVPPTAWVGHIPFAFWIMEVLRPGIFVEHGTQSGNSYSAFAQAVQNLRLSTQCHAVDTWRGDDHAEFSSEKVFEDYSRYHDARFADFSRLIRSTFDEALPYFGEQTIDLLHIDGLSTFEAVMHDFESWLPKLSARGVVLLHDIDVREPGYGVWRLWADLCNRYPHFAFHHSHGLGVLGVGKNVPAELKWLFGLSEGPATAETAAFVQVFFEQLGNRLVDRVELAQTAVRAATMQRERDELARQSDGGMAELRAVRADLDRCWSQLRAASTERDALLNSTSWRVTKPLRQFKDWLSPKAEH